MHLVFRLMGFGEKLGRPTGRVRCSGTENGNHVARLGLVDAKRPSADREGLLRLETRRRERAAVAALLRRGWGEDFALLARLRFGLGFGRLLNFFSAFVFASHG